MRSRRAGHGRTIGSTPPARSATRTAVTAGPASPAAKLSDVPNIAAALAVIALDVSAYEQTEAYCRLVWQVEP